jgi:predicted transposase YbfD/YdcC
MCHQLRRKISLKGLQIHWGMRGAFGSQKHHKINNKNLVHFSLSSGFKDMKHNIHVHLENKSSLSVSHELKINKCAAKKPKCGGKSQNLPKS